MSRILNTPQLGVLSGYIDSKKRAVLDMSIVFQNENEFVIHSCQVNGELLKDHPDSLTTYQELQKVFKTGVRFNINDLETMVDDAYDLYNAILYYDIDGTEVVNID